MTINEAIVDPKRPLSIAPQEGMLAVEAKLAEEQELTDKVVQRVVAAKKGQEPTKPLDVSAIEKMDAGKQFLMQDVDEKIGLEETLELLQKLFEE